MANGGFIGKRLVPIITSAKGVWTANELYHARLDGIWPLLVVNVVTDFLIIAGGAGGATGTALAGGGAGGYLNSYGSEYSGRNSASLNAMSLAILNTYAVTIGAGGSARYNGSNTTFSGAASDSSSISYTAIGGGAGGAFTDGWNGGSGGGGHDTSDAKIHKTPGSGTSNQGFDGGESGAQPSDWYFCSAIGGNFCAPQKFAGGGGGGAGGVGGSVNDGLAIDQEIPLVTGAGGAGLASLITGTSVTRAAGGSGSGSGFDSNDTNTAMPAGSGSSSNGGGGRGGGSNNTGGDGIIILRYSNLFSMTNPGGGLTISTATDGSDKVSSITAGTGNITFGIA